MDELLCTVTISGGKHYESNCVILLLNVTLIYAIFVHKVPRLI
jgi:hypothetical protein